MKNLRRTVVLLAVTSGLSLLMMGCSSRRASASRPPAPTQPVETPESTAETAKNETAMPSKPVAAAPRRGKTPPAPAPVGFIEEGNASWYGNPFNGRHASNGEVYDMYKLTAAHRTLPFDTMVRVTNLNNGKSTTVRITDRGPFVDNRIIDLSLAAAREIESIGPGVVHVRLEVLGNVDPTAGYFTIQVGAFRDRANAERLKARLSAEYSPIFIQQYDTTDGAFYRVRVGKTSGEDAARQLAEQLHNKEGFTTFVMRLDEGVAAGGK